MQRLAQWVAFGSVSFLAGSGLFGEEWPKWMGPQGTNIARDKIADHWPADGPARIWTAKVGLGFASVVGRDGKIYIIGNQGADDVLSAFDADSGKLLWAQGYPVGHKPKGDQATNRENKLPLPDASPTIDGDRIYTYGGGGDLVARQLADGKEVWKLNVLDETKAKNLTWNEASTPLVTDNLVYVQGGDGGAVAIAVEKATGKIAWQAEAGLGGYAAPTIVNVDNTPVLIIFGGDALYGLNPQTGKTLWKQEWKTQYDVNATTPLFHDNKLFISSGYGHGCGMFTLTTTGASLDWKGKEVASKYQPCILDNGKLYGSSGGVLKCLEWPSKKVIWSSREGDLGDGGSFIKDGDFLIAMSEQGMLSLLHLDADGPKTVSQVKMFEFDNVWSSPVLYHGKLYVKGKDELVCLDVSPK